MNFQVNSHFTYDEINQTILKRIKKSILVFNICLITFILCCVVSIILIAIDLLNETEVDSYNYFLLIFSASFAVLCAIYPFILKNIIKKNNKAYLDGLDYEYTFTDEEILIKSICKTSTNSSSMKYEGIVSVEENASELMLFINKVNFLILKKADVDPENLNQLIDKIKDKIKK